MANKNIFVYADWKGLDGPQLIGILIAEQLKGKEVFSFGYAPEWLKSGHQGLDPDLRLYPGKQYLAGDKPNFGMFLDSSPDRWGRLLMKRREAVLARKEKRKPVALAESDFLLGVFDACRMGALRFKREEDGPFLAAERQFAAPPWASLRELEAASLKLEKDGIKNDNEELKWLNMLIAPGSSLGGARPKANVSDPDGNLWIAKFPSNSDEVDMGAWEMVVHDLAIAAGLKVAPVKLMQLSSKHHTFLTQRFDREGVNFRIHFASAMTLLGQQDGADHQSGVSYLDLAGFIQQQGNQVNVNLEELWKRIVFNVMVKNTDDHLRNHGFVLTSQGWELSPAYDMNATPFGTGLTLNISDEDNSLDLGLVREVAPYFRVAPADTERIITDVTEAVSGWKKVAANYKLSKAAQDYMAPAFEQE